MYTDTHGYMKEFMSALRSVAYSYDTHTVFRDACRMFALAIRGQFTLAGNDHDAIEEEYRALSAKYGAKGTETISHMFSYVVAALEATRQDFLGYVYEDLNATVKNFGQYFTPNSLSRMMGRITFNGMKIVPGEIVTIGDPSCGAGALLIEGANEFVSIGGRQGDLLIYAEDLDATAANIAYVQLSMLGFAAVVTQMDSLARIIYGGPWYTPGYFLHAMPMRLRSRQMAGKRQANKTEDPAPASAPAPEPQPVAAPVQARELVQQEFTF